MAGEVLMPKMAYDMTEARIARWLKREGEPVRRGEPIAEIETDKAAIEIEAFEDGVLQEIVVPAGQTAQVGEKIAQLAVAGERPAPAAAPPEEATRGIGAGEGGEAVPEVGAAGPAARAEVTEAPRAPEPERRPVEKRPGPPERPAEPAAAEVRASPVARKLAEEHEIDLRELKGSGPGGRITREDVEEAIRQRERRAPAPPPTPAPPPPAAPAPPAPERVAAAPPPVELRELSRMRQTIGRRMAESKREAPHFYVSIEIDMTEALRLREQLNAAQERVRVSVNDFVVKACALALPKFPDLNATWADGRVELHREVHVALAVAVEDGLLAPVLRNCERLSLLELAEAARDLTGRAREGRLRADEYGGATFTVSNLGMYGVSSFIAIINPPQAAILAVGAASQRPVYRDGQLVPAELMNATISADHRITDGARAALFLAEVKRLLEHPVLLLVEETGRRAEESVSATGA